MITSLVPGTAGGKVLEELCKMDIGEFGSLADLLFGMPWICATALLYAMFITQASNQASAAPSMSLAMSMSQCRGLKSS
ncbi:unnamed protein product [Arabidopsis lyrata]|uniref:Predicted protein n=1 Tax=Arabidopsis lyrata subsp. lyrata TaxID=81972 RepID=D7LYW6_ARALL|nr:predicted protein [Arabidopsis lyrata subsp. lyrata]CAH8272915.1 unnamed protein product [Arabidopsis lyrata]